MKKEILETLIKKYEKTVNIRANQSEDIGNVLLISESAENGTFSANVDIPEGTEVSSVIMYYITSDTLAFGGGNETIGWQSTTEYTLNDNALNMPIPENATHLYVSITDQNGYIISSEFIHQKF